MKTLSRHPWILSLLIIVALAAWLASGMLSAQSTPTQESKSSKSHEIIPRVRVRSIAAKSVTRSLVLYGRSEPDRNVKIRPQLSGRLSAVLVKRGQRVSKGQVLAKIELYDRPQQLDAARAQLAQRQLEYQSSKSLSLKGYQGKAKLAQAKAALKLAQARVAQLELEIAYTRIRAPFDGVIDARQMEPGDYVSSGQKLATLLVLDPIIVRGDASQHDRASLHNGQTATVIFNNLAPKTGKLHYLSAQSNAKTNTFRIEVALDNPDYKILAGLSAKIELPLQTVKAIKISPALFSLNEDGVIGIKWVKHNIVEFTPIKIVKTEADGVWISGIAPNAHIITVGQAFVKKGDRVEAIDEKIIERKTEAAISGKDEAQEG